jgi:putative membrane protein
MGFARTCLALGLLVLVWSGLGPTDRKVWFMETLPVWAGGAVVAWRWRAFPWTPLAVALMTLFAAILCVGGHWTYSHVPVGNWVRDALGLVRNPWDRFGHFFQGVIPALLGRELLLRCTGLRPGKALFWVSASIALAISACYELTEWWAVLIAAPEQGMAFLGTQGDEWDAQWDMALALAGAILVQLLFARRHDRQIEGLPRPGGRPEAR